MKNYYVYVHKRKATGIIFYVGKGANGKNGQRAASYKNRNNWWKHIVNKDGGFDFEIIKDNLTEQQAFSYESDLISEIGLDNLSNITKGGRGGDTLTNHPDLDKIGKKISEHHKNSNNPNTGKGYYYWWVKRYGKEKADEMHNVVIQTRANKLRGQKRPTGISNEERLRNKYGKDYIQKDLEIREKLRIFAKNRIRKIIKCEKCDKEVSDSHIKLHKCK